MESSGLLSYHDPRLSDLFFMFIRPPPYTCYWELNAHPTVPIITHLSSHICTVIRVVCRL
jgi:hypothetical protein